jgi:hypothetical protein
MKKFKRCTALLGFLLLFSAGVNYIFIGIPGGMFQRAGSTPQQTSAADCTPDPKHCSLAVR